MKTFYIKICFLSLIFLLGILTNPLFAKTYKWTDENGKTHYTDDMSKVPQKYRKENEKKKNKERSADIEVGLYCNNPVDRRTRQQLDSIKKQFQNNAKLIKKYINIGAVERAVSIAEKVGQNKRLRASYNQLCYGRNYATASGGALDVKIKGYGISLRDIERKCEVYKYSRSYGDVECRGSELNSVEANCEAYFGLIKNGELECKGSKFRSIEQKCSVNMYSDRYGYIEC